MRFFVYILYSYSSQKTYVGFTDDIDRRVFQHNNQVKKTFTSSYRPWVIINTEVYENKSEAIAREKWYKSGVGREHKRAILSQYLKSDN
jgi:putative endonuclease